jgi:hypothetical protein
MQLLSDEFADASPSCDDVRSRIKTLVSDKFLNRNETKNRTEDVAFLGEVDLLIDQTINFKGNEVARYRRLACERTKDARRANKNAWVKVCVRQVSEHRTSKGDPSETFANARESLRVVGEKRKEMFPAVFEKNGEKRTVFKFVRSTEPVKPRNPLNRDVKAALCIISKHQNEINSRAPALYTLSKPDLRMRVAAMEAWEECAGQQTEERVRSVLTNVVKKLLEDEIKLTGWCKTKFANDRVFKRIVKALRPVLDGKTSQEDAAGDYHVNPFNRFLVSTN